MEQIVIVFASRTESMRFSEYLTRSGVMNMIINTPRELSLGCGISVAVDNKYLETAKYLLGNYEGQYSLKGIYRLIKSGMKNIIIPV